MTFYGKTQETPAPSKPMRTFTYKTWGGAERIVEADYLQFMPEHVTFWKAAEADEPDKLVLAEANKDVHGLVEQ